MNKKQKKTLARIVLAAVLVVTLGLLPIRGSLRLALYPVSYTHLCPAAAERPPGQHRPAGQPAVSSGGRDGAAL